MLLLALRWQQHNVNQTSNSQQTPHTLLTGELWGAFNEDLGNKWTRFNSTELYAYLQTKSFLYASVHTSILCRSVPKLDESTTCRHLKSPQSRYPVPDSKVHGAYMGPTGPRWVPWTLLYGMDPNTSHWSPKGHGHEWLTHIILFNVYWPSHSWDIAYQNLTLKIWGQGHGLHQIEWPH